MTPAAHIRAASMANAAILAEILRRCRVTEDDCWLWLRATSKCGQPIVNANFTGRRARYAHRLAWIASGRKLNPEHILPATCGHAACCNPEHRRAMSRVAWEKTAQRKARASRGAAHGVTVSIARRRSGKGIVLSIDLARQIRARFAEIGNHTHVAREFSERLGRTIRATDVHRIVFGQRWREPSPFPV